MRNFLWRIVHISGARDSQKHARPQARRCWRSNYGERCREISKSEKNLERGRNRGRGFDHTAWRWSAPDPSKREFATRSCWSSFPGRYVYPSHDQCGRLLWLTHIKRGHRSHCQHWSWYYHDYDMVLWSLLIKLTQLSCCNYARLQHDRSMLTFHRYQDLLDFTQNQANGFMSITIPIVEGFEVMIYQPNIFNWSLKCKLIFWVHTSRFYLASYK